MRIAFIFAILATLLAYVGWHLWILFPLPRWGRWAMVALMVLTVVLAVATITRYMDLLPMPVASVLYNVAQRALVLLLYLFLLLLVADLLRLCHVLPAAWLRDSWATVIVVVALMAAVAIYGRLHYEHKARVEISVDTHGLVARPLKMVAVSDLHLGYHNRYDDLARWIAMINDEEADFVLVAGDVIDRSLRPLRADAMDSLLRHIKAPVYACLGNHEYYAGYYDHPAEVERFYRDAGITLLRDSVAVLADENIAILGRDDRTNARRKSLKALKTEFGIRDSLFTILLDHQPFRLEESQREGIGLQVSGHTHRGQVWPLTWLTDVLYECSWGVVQKGSTTVCVSSGLGIWGAKYRIGSQSEYLVIKLF